ncbi:Hypothetical predicted protein [Pelobates cultripes]|uniref:Uncharacterized protein n=1 Tax=Pelobates cultripes TaxID=61616 RepID=A0AAD1RWZ2_PELCU|nr:Hypothetical predicted protein [Pelobates cultripes]
MGCCFSKELCPHKNIEKTSTKGTTSDEETKQASSSENIPNVHVGEKISNPENTFATKQSICCARPELTHVFFERPKYPSYHSMDDTNCVQKSNRSRSINFFNPINYACKVLANYENLKTTEVEEYSDNVIKPEPCSVDSLKAQNAEIQTQSSCNLAATDSQHGCDHAALVHVSSVTEQILPDVPSLKGKHLNWTHSIPENSSVPRQEKSVALLTEDKSLLNISTSRECTVRTACFPGDAGGSDMRHSQTNKFYSICVVDDEDLNLEDNFALSLTIKPDDISLKDSTAIPADYTQDFREDPHANHIESLIAGRPEVLSQLCFTDISSSGTQLKDSISLLPGSPAGTETEQTNLLPYTNLLEHSTDVFMVSSVCTTSTQDELNKQTDNEPKHFSPFIEPSQSNPYQEAENICYSHDSDLTSNAPGLGNYPDNPMECNNDLPSKKSSQVLRDDHDLPEENWDLQTCGENDSSPVFNDLESEDPVNKHANHVLADIWGSRNIQYTEEDTLIQKNVHGSTGQLFHKATFTENAEIFNSFPEQTTELVTLSDTCNEITADQTLQQFNELYEKFDSVVDLKNSFTFDPLDTEDCKMNTGFSVVYQVYNSCDVLCDNAELIDFEREQSGDCTGIIRPLDTCLLLEEPCSLKEICPQAKDDIELQDSETLKSDVLPSILLQQNLESLESGSSLSEAQINKDSSNASVETPNSLDTTPTILGDTVRDIEYFNISSNADMNCEHREVDCSVYESVAIKYENQLHSPEHTFLSDQEDKLQHSFSLPDQKLQTKDDIVQMLTEMASDLLINAEYENPCNDTNNKLNEQVEYCTTSSNYVQDQVDQYAATPSYEIHKMSHCFSDTNDCVPSSETSVLDLMQDVLKESQNRSKIQYDEDRKDLPLYCVISDEHFMTHPDCKVDYLWHELSEDLNGSSQYHCNPGNVHVTDITTGKYAFQMMAPENNSIWGWPETCSESESTKVSELNPNAKVWGNHMLHVEAGGTADGTVGQSWEELPDEPPDSSKEGMRSSQDDVLLALVALKPLEGFRVSQCENHKEEEESSLPGAGERESEWIHYATIFGRSEQNFILSFQLQPNRLADGVNTILAQSLTNYQPQTKHKDMPKETPLSLLTRDRPIIGFTDIIGRYSDHQAHYKPSWVQYKDMLPSSCTGELEELLGGNNLALVLFSAHISDQRN